MQLIAALSQICSLADCLFRIEGRAWVSLRGLLTPVLLSAAKLTSLQRRGGIVLVARKRDLGPNFRHRTGTLELSGPRTDRRGRLVLAQGCSAVEGRDRRTQLHTLNKLRALPLLSSLSNVPADVEFAQESRCLPFRESCRAAASGGLRPPVTERQDNRDTGTKQLPHKRGARLRLDLSLRFYKLRRVAAQNAANMWSFLEGNRDRSEKPPTKKRILF